MADTGDWPNQNPLASGLFGIFQAAAQAGRDTASIWSDLRVAAGTWRFQAQGGGELPPVAQLEADGRQVLSDQGFNIQTVNSYRAIAGQWRSARENLATQADTSQITARELFVPPWATTADSAVPARYRIRVLWDGLSPSGEAFTARGTYELDSPLTNVADAIEQAQQLAGRKPTSDTPLGATITAISDFEIEQV